MRYLPPLALLTAVALGACSREPATPVAGKDAGAELPSMETMMQGARLFQEHCAQCHGPEAQGHPDWQNPEVVAAPPLDGTGKAWQRRRADMVAMIKGGAVRKNEPVMPAWKDRLSDADIDAIITWYVALWPMAQYEQWQKLNAAPPVVAAPAPATKKR